MKIPTQTEGQSDKLTCIGQNIQGKIAELATFHIFNSPSLKLSPVDFNIYTTSKSWEPDLKVLTLDSVPANGIRSISVKSCSYSTSVKFGESYVFEKTDPILTTSDYNHFVSFVLVDMFSKTAVIKCFLPIKLLIDNNLFKPLKIKSLISKTAIYMKDLEELWQ